MDAGGWGCGTVERATAYFREARGLIAASCAPVCGCACRTRATHAFERPYRSGRTPAGNHSDVFASAGR